MTDEQKISSVMELGYCSRDEAVDLLKQSGNDVIEALVLLLKVKPDCAAPKQKKMDEVQQFFTEMRQTLTTLTDSISKGFTSSDQSESSGHSETQIPHEGKAQQNNYFQECLIPSRQEEVQIPGTACPLPSGCSSDSQ
jgi:hypothetical protein